MSGDADLAPCVARVEWAIGAVHSFDHESAAWLAENNPAATSVEYHAEADIHTFRMRAEIPPLRFGVLAGNVAHQLRSTLDNLVVQLVRLNGGRPKRSNKFPIFEPQMSNEEFAEATSKSLIGVHPAHRAVIEGQQPYREPAWALGEHPLIVLKRLSNTDKHQVLQTAVVKEVPEAAVARVKAGHGVDVLDRWWGAPDQRELGAIIGWAQLSPPGFHPDVTMDAAGFARLAFAASSDIASPLQGRSITRTLWELTSTVEAFVSAFFPATLGISPDQLLGAQFPLDPESVTVRSAELAKRTAPYFFDAGASLYPPPPGFWDGYEGPEKPGSGQVFYEL